VLLSFDNDFDSIAARLPKAARRRFRKLSRIHMAVKGLTAHIRMAAALSLIEFEWAESTKREDDALCIWIVIQPTAIKNEPTISFGGRVSRVQRVPLRSAGKPRRRSSALWA
jgi:hypothetical protein